MTWDNHNEPILLCGMVMFPQKKHMVLVTHKESTFYSKTQWIHKSERPDPVNKGEGSSLMVSDFCSPDLGWLKSKDGWMNLSFSLMRRTLIICVGLKKLVLFSKLAKSWWLLSLCRPLHRLNRPSKFLKTIFPELQWLHLGLTILHDEKSWGCTLSLKHAQVSKALEARQVQNVQWCSSKWGTTRFLLCRQPSHNAWSIQRNEGYPRGTRLQRGSQFTSQVSCFQMPRPKS